MANIKARKKLEELFRVGVEVRFGVDPESGRPSGSIGPFEKPASDDEVAMFVRPPSPLQREQALRDAQAKRARALVAIKRNEDSEEHLTALAFLAEMSDDTLYEYLLTSEQGERRQEAIRETLGLEEWKDITDLQDAMRQFEDMPPEERENNEEWAALLERDEKFGDQVAEREKELSDAYRDVLQMLGRERAEKKAMEKRGELVGSQAFMEEYEIQMLFYSVREVDDEGVLFFSSAREFAEQPDEVREKLGEAMLPFISEGAEAKN